MSEVNASAVTETAAAPAPATTPAPATARRPFWNFAWHFAEMMIAMMVGMMALGPLWRLAFGAFGAAALIASPIPAALVMATNMTIGMSLLMWFRRHSWRSIAEMGAAMYLSFVVLFPAYWLGWIDGGALMGLGHVLMIPAMIGAMLWRRDEYTRGHADH